MIWLLASILVPCVSALLCLATSSNSTLNRVLGVGGTVVLLANSIMLILAVNHAGGYVSFQSGNWAAPFGITMIADWLSASMVLITAIVGLCVAVYSLSDIDSGLIRSHYFALFHFLLMGVNGAFITGDLFNLYVWFEVMLIASFVLITMGGKRDQLEGGVKYLIINLLSSILFLTGVRDCYHFRFKRGNFSLISYK